MELSIKDLKEILCNNTESVVPAPKPCVWEIGKHYFIRTVTMHVTGTLTMVTDQELMLKDAAWIADSGRFNEALKDISKCKEVEPFKNPAILGRGSIIDATEIDSVITEVR